MVEKELTETEKKEATRAIQLGILTSESTKNLYIASAGKDTAKYGEVGKNATQFNYLTGLQNPDKHVAKLTSQPFLEAAINAKQRGLDMYEEGAVTPMMLLRNARNYYMSAIDNVKVGDVLGLMGIKKVHDKNISATEKEMYMEDFKTENERMYGQLMSTYFSSVESEGVGEAIKNSATMQRKSLEMILNEDPDKPRGETE